MSVLISGVEARSPAARSGVLAGDVLASINGHPVEDVLDYRFYMTERRLSLGLVREGKEIFLHAVKGEYDDLGLQFDTYLMDKQRACRNKCVFCFIDQLPKGLRESLYFKDDDSRMSFLFGNYITLTNLRERDVERIMEMRISPVNVSVHTTNPALRVEMMGNPHAGEALEILPRLARAGIRLNAQLVLCPGLNDGEELRRSLGDLAALAPALQSVAAVPVGLTKHREGLFPLRLFTAAEARAVLDILDEAGAELLARHGSRTFYASDEFYLLAGRPLPDYSHYGDFYQLENGVGMLRLLEHEFHLALAGEEARRVSRRAAVATGKAAAPFLERWAGEAMARFPGLELAVYPVENRFFGPDITVSGLLTGSDLLEGLAGKSLGQELLLPGNTLRREGDLFLDDKTVPQLEEALGVPVRTVDNDGFSLLDALLGV